MPLAHNTGKTNFYTEQTNKRCADTNTTLPVATRAGKSTSILTILSTAIMIEGWELRPFWMRNYYILTKVWEQGLYHIRSFSLRMKSIWSDNWGHLFSGWEIALFEVRTEAAKAKHWLFQLGTEDVLKLISLGNHKSSRINVFFKN